MLANGRLSKPDRLRASVRVRVSYFRIVRSNPQPWCRTRGKLHSKNLVHAIASTFGTVQALFSRLETGLGVQGANRSQLFFFRDKADLPHLKS